MRKQADGRGGEIPTYIGNGSNQNLLHNPRSNNGSDDDDNDSDDDEEEDEDADGETVPTPFDLTKVNLRTHPYFKTKWTSSNHGNQRCGWTKQGIDRFNFHYHNVKALRKQPRTGGQMEEALRKHWKGFQKSADSAVQERPTRVHVEACTDDNWLKAISEPI